MVGDQIRVLRTARKITQTQLAKELGVSKQSVSNWENNNIAPSVDMVRKIALYFRCSADFLLELNEGRFMIEIDDLTEEQRACVQMIADQFHDSNAGGQKQISD